MVSLIICCRSVIADCAYVGNQLAIGDLVRGLYSPASFCLVPLFFFFFFYYYFFFHLCLGDHFLDSMTIGLLGADRLLFLVHTCRGVWGLRILECQGSMGQGCVLGFLYLCFSFLPGTLFICLLIRLLCVSVLLQFEMG